MSVCGDASPAVPVIYFMEFVHTKLDLGLVFAATFCLRVNVFRVPLTL